jgi:hypothetical protein
MRVRGLAAAIAASVLFAACGSSMNQPTGGDGWTLGRVVYPSQRSPGVAVASAGDEALGLEITVAGPGGGNCGVPVFTGFERMNNVLLARVKRGAEANCKSSTRLTWSVIVSRAWLPADLTQVAVEEPCGEPGCMGAEVALPR